MQSKKISQHFSMAEFERSATAVAHGIDNHIPSGCRHSLEALCENVLEPLRNYVNGPVIISSGYRCRELNELVGGVKMSQHLLGEAADVLPSPTSYRTLQERDAILRDWYDWIRRYLEFDQVILERSGDKRWLHVSYREGRNRLRSLRY